MDFVLLIKRTNDMDKRLSLDAWVVLIATVAILIIRFSPVPIHIGW